MREIVLVFRDNKTQKYKQEHNSDLNFEWTWWFEHNPDLEYMEYRLDGERTKQFNRQAFYKHLASLVE